jgi:hypothetical protein
MKMLTADVMVYTIDAALEKGEVAFNAIFQRIKAERRRMRRS